MKLKTLVVFVTLIFVFFSVQVLGSEDKPGSVTIDSCSFDGKAFSIKGHYSDGDGVSKIVVTVDGRERCSSNSCDGCFKFDCSATINDEAKSSCSIEVTITDKNGNTTSTSKTCYS